MLFDSHAHINDSWFDDDRENVLNKIKSSDTSFYAEIGTDIPSSIAALELAKKYDFIYAVGGIYPHSAKDAKPDDIEKLRQLCGEEKFVAIGEIGLDYHWDDTDIPTQKEWFHIQLDLAKEMNMPVAIHSRDAMEDTIKILGEHKGVGGIIHCFSGSKESAKILLDMGFYISFAGPVTFKNARRLTEAAEIVPLSRLLIETDSPYLSPEPHRGERNDPSNVSFVAKKIAEIKGISFSEVAKATMENAKNVYRIK